MDQDPHIGLNRDAYGFDAPVKADHPIRSNLPVGQSVGLAVGEDAPDFELSDSGGKAVQFHQHRDNKRCVVVFFRSAVW